MVGKMQHHGPECNTTQTISILNDECYIWYVLKPRIISA